MGPKSEHAPSSRQSHRILVVDDEEGMRAMLSLMLERQGFEVRLAADAEAALTTMSSGEIDVVLCDLRMPEVDGLELLRRIQAQKSPVIVIMMSAFAELDDAIAALKLGAADYVSKPFKADEVVWKIRLAEERHRLEEERLRLRAENARLRGELDDEAAVAAPAGFIGKSHRLKEILGIVRKVADYKSTVLVNGESGTGKELVARALHDLSCRQSAPFVPINCGAIPETLLESELFGYTKGAFTDATRDRRGLVEEAHGGTLFLDEIGELPLSLQVKLLRFLQEEEIRKVGGARGIKVDVRVVAATARDLNDMVTEGTFRTDLYYRLNVLQLTVPPLRERKDDIPLLVEHFLAKYGVRLKREQMSISRDALRLLLDYHWPGNIRELENTIERAMVLCDTDRIEVANLPDKLKNVREPTLPMLAGDDLSIKRATRAIEQELIKRALEHTGGNRTRAAEVLEISHRALLYKIKEFGIT